MTKKIKILCHSCEGQRYVIENKFPNGEEVKVLCPECNGNMYVEAEEYSE